MKKQAIDTIDLKKQELQGTINDALRLLNTKLQEATKELTDKATQEMEKIVADLSDTVEQKMNEAKSLVSRQTQVPAGTTAPTQPAQADDIDWKKLVGKTWSQLVDWFGPSEEELRRRQDREENSVAGIRGSVEHDISIRAKKKKKRLSPRDTEDNSKLPEFWRPNKDLGEGPYLYMDRLSKITDEVAQDILKKRKKSASGASHLLFFSETHMPNMMYSADVRAVEVATGKVIDAKGFRGKPGDRENLATQGLNYIKSLQQKMPQHKIKAEYNGPPGHETKVYKNNFAQYSG